MEVTKIPKKIVTVIEPKRSITVDKEKYRQKCVAAYCRVSTDSEEQLVSYTNQKKVYTEMIASRKDWCFAGLFADEGKSGTRADKRPEFNKMINDCLAGKIDYIITTSKKGRKPQRHSVQMRRRAVERSIVTMTALDTANALANSLMSKRTRNDVELVDITKI